VAIWDEPGGIRLVPRAEADPTRIVVHRPDADDPTVAFALSRLDGPDLAHVPMGIFRNVTRTTYDDAVRAQIDSARTVDVTDADIDALLAGQDTWTVSA
jgi:2-oxoglutarate ferredoxin oxidoreductase subunit beta